MIVNYMDSLTPGGINTVVRELAKHMARHGHKILLFNPSWTLKKLTVKRYGNLIYVKGYRYIKPLYGLDIRNLMLALRLIKKFKPQIIHIHGYHNLFSQALIMLVKMFHPDIPLIFSPHFSVYGHTTFAGRHFFHIYNVSIGRAVLQMVDRIISSSLFECKCLQSETMISKEKIIYVPHGVPFTKDSCKGILRTNDDETRLLYVGYLFEFKGVQDAIRALSILIKKYDLDNVKLVIVGRGPFENKLKRIAKELGVENKIEWKGFLKSKLIQEFCSADIFIFPSRGEMFGLVAYEALALGLPVIVAKKGALIECTKYRMCIAANSPDEIAIAVLRLIKNETGDRTKFEQDNILTWEEVARLYESIYTKLIRSKSLDTN